MNPDEVTGTDRVDHAFGNVLALVNATATAPSAGDIATRGRRRRARHLVLTSVAVTVLIVGGCSLLPWAATSPEPTDSPAVTSPSAIRPAPTGSRQDTSGRFPAGFMLHENDGGERIDKPSLLLERCYGRPLLRAAVVRSVGERAAEVKIYHDLYLYVDEAAARQTMVAVRQQELRSCIGFPNARVLKKAESPPWGDEAATMTVAVPADGANEHTVKPLRIIVVRVGAAVAVFWGYPEIPEIEQDARAVIPRLCLYDADCRPAAGLPAPLEKLSNGGEAWVAVLDVFSDTDLKAKPGVAMASAAELGYRPMIVPIECDDGAAKTLGRTETGVKYVAVYFSSGQDAQAFVAALPRLKVWTLAVRTHCVPA